ncbi:MAG: transglutaminase family protein [Victivallales bacterium]|nr:transglutaminase family protein [Victivallales bacterium]
METEAYLESTDVIDWETPAVCRLAQKLSSAHTQAIDVARSCFEWGRDEIDHSGDIRASVVTCSASDVLSERTGWCFAKSHLLAALLRANGIPTGLCYQRLRRDDGAGFTLHGLNAILLPHTGWYRVDARGNKPGVNAQFTPPVEQLAWPVAEPGEIDLPEIWARPLPIVVEYLRENNSLVDATRNLPDIELIETGHNQCHHSPR